MARKKRMFGDHNLVLSDIEPLTDNQYKAFESTKHMVLYGSSGTGKTFISLFLAFDDLYKEDFNQIVIIRSAVSTRDIGFLPGTEKEKTKVYEEPYYTICNELFGRGDAYEMLKTKSIVHFMTTSFIRGLTLKDSIIIVDECQNCTYHELDSLITRVGENCRIIFCGDFNQSDLKANGLSDFLKILKAMNSFDLIEFGIEDIVRSDFVREYLTQKQLLGIK